MIKRFSSYNWIVLLTGLTFLVWWSGLAGSQLYWAPTLILLIYSLYRIRKGSFNEVVIDSVGLFFSWVTSSSGLKWIKILFLTHGGIWVGVNILKFYSFSYSLHDVGWYSNEFFNISQGEFYSSIINAHSFANHFTPSMAFLGLLYKITPSVHWMMVCKTLSFLASPIVIYLIGKELFTEKEKALKVSIGLSFVWFFFYRPIVNSVRFDFSPSSLAPVFIFLAFLYLLKEKWGRFFIIMVFLLGMKVNVATVWIGFGLYLVLAGRRKKLGVALTIAGILAIYLILFQITPYFRDYAELFDKIDRVNLFVDIPGKAYYLFKLLLPLGFIPLIFWKNGIMAAPAIGINLISGYAKMYSSHYHYDDVAAPLLFIAVIVSLREFNLFEVWSNLLSKKYGKGIFIFWCLFFLHLLPYSSLRFLKGAIPNKDELATGREVIHFESISRGKQVAVQDVLAPHFFRKEIAGFQQGADCSKENTFLQGELPHPYPPYEYIVLAPGLSNYRIRNMKQCLRDLENAPEFEKLDQYKYLAIFKKIKS